MNILLTGSSGFIGYHLSKELTKKDFFVTGIDNHNNYYDINLKQLRKSLLESKNFAFLNQDIRNLKLSDKHFDLVIHLAAQAGVRCPRDKEYLYDENNVNGFKKICEFCIQNKVNKLIYASSSSVYSDSDKKKFNEKNTILDPISKYGKTKLFNEQYASKISKNFGIHCIGLRFFSVYGPYGRPDMAYFKFAESLKKNKRIKLNNLGSMKRDMTYIDDIVDGILLSINYLVKNEDRIKNEIFNLGNGTPILISDLLKMMEKKLEKTAIIENNFTNNESAYTHADIGKAKKFLGYNPKTSIEVGISNFLKWHMKYEKI
tara:strand:- start:902 stop:1852 length:951 start_codon:yes stop_codon:yes gene_type:complete